MKKTFKYILIALLLLACGTLTVFYIVNNDIAILEPKGIIGEKERDLIITSSLLMLVVVIPVFALTWFFAWKYRASNHRGVHAPDWEHNYIAEYSWWGVPFIIVVILSFLCWRSSHDLSPFRPIESDVKPLTIQAVALQWKWLFIYPEQGIATINYIQFPDNTPIHFEITADAPMNSFWIPKLGGQIYAMPAMRSTLYLMAREPGTFDGTSANFSGKGFAGMDFKAVASSQQDYEQWISKVRSSPKQLGFIEYEKLALPSENDPPSFYILSDPQLFDQIIKKYTVPQPKK